MKVQSSEEEVVEVSIWCWNLSAVAAVYPSGSLSNFKSHVGCQQDLEWSLAALGSPLPFLSSPMPRVWMYNRSRWIPFLLKPMSFYREHISLCPWSWHSLGFQLLYNLETKFCSMWKGGMWLRYVWCSAVLQHSQLGDLDNCPFSWLSIISQVSCHKNNDTCFHQSVKHQCYTSVTSCFSGYYCGQGI